MKFHWRWRSFVVELRGFEPSEIPIATPFSAVPCEFLPESRLGLGQLNRRPQLEKLKRYMTGTCGRHQSALERMSRHRFKQMSEAMGRSAGRLVGRAYDSLTKSMSEQGQAPDGRRFADILREDGMEELKRARDLQFREGWLHPPSAGSLTGNQGTNQTSGGSPADDRTDAT